LHRCRQGCRTEGEIRTLVGRISSENAAILAGSIAERGEIERRIVRRGSDPPYGGVSPPPFRSAARSAPPLLLAPARPGDQDAAREHAKTRGDRAGIDFRSQSRHGEGIGCQRQHNQGNSCHVIRHSHVPSSFYVLMTTPTSYPSPTRRSR